MYVTMVQKHSIIISSSNSIVLLNHGTNMITMVVKKNMVVSQYISYHAPQKTWYM